MSAKGKFVALVEVRKGYGSIVRSSVLMCTDDAGLSFETYIPDAGDDVYRIVELLNKERLANSVVVETE